MHTSSLPLGKRLVSGLSAGHSKHQGTSRTWWWFRYPQSVSAPAGAPALFKTEPCFLLAACGPQGSIRQLSRSGWCSAPARHWYGQPQGRLAKELSQPSWNPASAASLQFSLSAARLVLAFVVQLMWKNSWSLCVCKFLNCSVKKRVNGIS